MELPIPNTPWILERKRKRIRKIWIWTASLCAGFISAFLISFQAEPPAPFLFSICSIAAPFLVLFIAAMLHFHVKYFPEFDYGNLTPEEIQALPVSKKYQNACRMLRRRKTIQFLFVVVFAFVGTLPVLLDMPADGEHTIFTLQTLISTAAILGTIISANYLQKSVALRRQLELQKYTLE